MLVGPFSPFIGSGVGVARLVDDTRMTFPKTTTLVPGARRVNLAWILMTGVATSLSEAVTLDLAWRYTDLGDVETGRAKGQAILARREQRTAGTRSRRHAGKADEPRASAFPALRLLRLEPPASQRTDSRGDHQGCVSDVETRVLAFQRHYQSLARPFEWTFTRRDLARLLAKLALQKPDSIAA